MHDSGASAPRECEIIFRGHRPRKRAIQYSRGVEIKTKGRSVLDTPHAGFEFTSPRLRQGYRIWLRMAMRKALSQPARLILRRREARSG